MYIRKRKGRLGFTVDCCSYSAKRIRTYSGELPFADAVEKAITECIQENILRDFLLKNRAEAKAMSIYEYDEA